MPTWLINWLKLRPTLPAATDTVKCQLRATPFTAPNTANCDQYAKIVNTILKWKTAISDNAFANTDTATEADTTTHIVTATDAATDTDCHCELERDDNWCTKMPLEHCQQYRFHCNCNQQCDRHANDTEAKTATDTATDCGWNCNLYTATVTNTATDTVIDPSEIINDGLSCQTNSTALPLRLTLPL